MKLARPEPLRIELERTGRTYTLPIATRGQIRRVLALDPADPAAETPAQADERRGKITAILLEGGELAADELTAQEEVEIIHALIAQHHGLDPADSVALARVLQKKVPGWRQPAS